MSSADELMINTYFEERLCLGPIFLLREAGIHKLYKTKKAFT
jgi:hypothetical protein